MKKTKDVTCMVVDTGIFVDAAVMLAKSMKKVYYCNPGWVSGTPRQNDAEIGRGLEGIEVVSDVHDHFDDVDLYVFFDIYFGTLQVWLEGQGKAVWGSRMAEELEIDRIKCREQMKEKGLPVAPYQVITGMEKLRAFLKTHGDKYVKTNKWRGTMETLYAKDYRYIKPRLDKLEYDLGPFSQSTRFLVEDALPDRIELGIDTWCIDGKFPDCSLTGIEIKDCAYVGRMMERENIPEPVRRFTETFTPDFKKAGYRGFISDETRIGKDKVPYMIDATMRMPSPPGELYSFMFTNFADIVWYGANGKVIEPEERAEFGVQAVIHSSWAMENFQPIIIPEKFRDQVRIHNAIRIGEEYYVLPQDSPAEIVGSVVACGDSYEACFDEIKAITKEIDGYQIEVDVEAFDKAEEQLAKAEKMGFNFLTK